jgi:hypothetical protein
MSVSRSRALAVFSLRALHGYDRVQLTGLLAACVLPCVLACSGSPGDTLDESPTPIGVGAPGGGGDAGSKSSASSGGSKGAGAGSSGSTGTPSSPGGSVDPGTGTGTSGTPAGSVDAGAGSADPKGTKDAGAMPTKDAGAPPAMTNAFTGAGAYKSQGGNGGHAEGQPCLNCHKPGGEAGGRVWKFAGTIYKDSAGKSPASNVEIRVRDKSGKAVSVYSNGEGYFYSDGGNFSFPALTGARNAANTNPMEGEIDNGNCNSCHNGKTTGRLFVK